jgi:hypothetical protein
VELKPLPLLDCTPLDGWKPPLGELLLDPLDELPDELPDEPSDPLEPEADPAGDLGFDDELPPVLVTAA